MFKNFIFDLDGTLIDSAYDIRRVLRQSIIDNGFVAPEDVFIPVGPTLDRITKILVPEIPDEIVKKVLIDFRKHYLTQKLDRTIPFDGIIETLQYIKSLNLNSFIATFKPKDASEFFAKKFFDGLYLDCITPNDLPFFDSARDIIKSDMLNFLIDKWKLDPKECIMIGDSQSDIEGAKGAGIFSIAAAYGYGLPEELKNANIKINSSLDLREEIRKLIKIK